MPRACNSLQTAVHPVLHLPCCEWVNAHTRAYAMLCCVVVVYSQRIDDVDDDEGTSIRHV